MRSEGLVQVEERVDHSRIKLTVPLGRQFGKHGVDRPRETIGPAVRQGIEDVGHGDDPGLQRDAVATQTSRVSGAIPSLVMTGGDALGGLHEYRVASGENLGA